MTAQPKSFYIKVLPIVLTIALSISAVVSTIILIILLISLIKGMPASYISAVFTGILAIATIAYIFVAVLLLKSYRN